jgi:hypothetical protein
MRLAPRQIGNPMVKVEPSPGRTQYTNGSGMGLDDGAKYSEAHAGSRQAMSLGASAVKLFECQHCSDSKLPTPQSVTFIATLLRPWLL